MKKNGFTLIEILISMSLFTLIGFAVVMLMRTGVDIWVRGSDGSLAEDRLEQSLPRLEEDLRHVVVPPMVDRIPFDPKNPDPAQEPDPLPPDNRFISGYHVFKLREQEVPCRFLAFVRDSYGLNEIETYATRAGTNPKAENYVDGKDDEEEFRQNTHLPIGGRVEVLWIWLPDVDRPGVGTVYRAFRAPIGGKGTLLDPKNYDAMDEIWRVIKPQPVIQNVIMFDLLFWTQYTTSWEWSEEEPVVTQAPQEPSEITRGRPRCGPSRIWDSTRGLFPRATRDNPFGFKLWREGSFNFANDDIWPRSVRVEFSLIEEETALARSMSLSDRGVTVVISDFATGRGDLHGQLMKVGPEWVRIDQRDAMGRDTFVVDRSKRGTGKYAHPEGSPVYFGRVFDVTITVPAFRDDNN